MNTMEIFHLPCAPLPSSSMLSRCFCKLQQPFQQLFKSFNIVLPFIIVFVFALPCGLATSHSLGVKSPPFVHLHHGFVL